MYADAGTQSNVDPLLLKAQGMVESGLNPNNVGPQTRSGTAKGIAQFIDSTAQQYGVTNPFAPSQAIPGQAKMMDHLLTKYGNPADALRAYNAGDDQSRWNNPETQAYTGKVATAYAQLQAAQQQPGASVATPQTDAVLAQLRGGSTPAAAPPAADADPYVTLGEQVTSGKPASSAAAAAPDPYVSAGEAVTAPILAAPPVNAAAADVPQSIDPPKTTVPLIDNLASGALQGVRDVVGTGANLAKYVDANVPLLSRLDSSIGIDAGATANKLLADRQQYEASPAGQTLAGGIGRFVGQGVATLPALGPLGGAIGAGGEALAGAADAVSPALGRGIGAVGNLLTGTASGGARAGITANMLVKSAGLAGQGAVAGAGYGALTAGANDQTLGQNMLSGAEGGAIAGPAIGAVAGGIGALGKGAGYLANKLTGAKDPAVQEAIDATIARAKAAVVPASNNPVAPSIAPPTSPPTSGSPASFTAGAPLGASPAAAPTASPGIGAPATGWGQNTSSWAAQPPGAAAAPGSMGAAAVPPGSAPAMTAAQANASKLTGFNYRMSQQAPLAYDNTPYVTGSTPTLAEAAADPAMAGQQRVIAAGDADFANLDRKNNEARYDHFDDLGGTPTTTQTLKAARSDEASANLQAAFSKTTPTDATPVMDLATGIMNDPRLGENDDIRKYVGLVQQKLLKPDGTLKNDPENLYGVRENITNMLSKPSLAANPAVNNASGQLLQLKNALDQVIEVGAPGYKKYMSDYATASRPIDAQELLQSYRPNLSGADGTMQLSRVNSMLKNIGGQLSSSGLSDAKSLTDDQLDGLFNLRSDLLRQNNRNLARPSGSDTANNLSVMGQLGTGAATAGAHALVSHIPGANMLLNAVMDNATGKAAAANRATLKNALLNPPQ